MKCEKCDAELIAQATECPYCGTAVDTTNHPEKETEPTDGALLLDSILGRITNADESPKQTFETKSESAIPQLTLEPEAEQPQQPEPEVTPPSEGEEALNKLEEKTSRKNPLKIIIIVVLLLALAAAGFVWGMPFLKYNADYKAGLSSFENGDYYSARNHLTIPAEADYRDSANIIRYIDASEDLEAGYWVDAYYGFASTDYKDSASVANDILANKSTEITNLIADLDLDNALQLYDALKSIPAASQYIPEILEQYEDCAELLMQSGHYFEASAVYEVLADAGYDNADTMAVYATAKGAYDEQRYYDAMLMFNAAAPYADSVEMAEKCVIPAPKSGVLYRNSKYAASTMEIKIIAPSAEYSPYAFVKIYTPDETHVASLFINASGSATVALKPGEYKIKVGYGETWYGPENAFGDDGSYGTLTFPEETYNFPYGYVTTIQLRVSTGGNVGSDYTDRSDF